MSRCNNTLEVLQLKESLHSIDSCQYMELFPDTSISEVYSKAKINCPFERLFYDEMEDCLVAVLYATSGEFEQTLSIPCQITFGDFCIKHQDLRSFTTAPRSYKLEEHRGQVNDKKYYHLLEGGGLFSCGLPSMIGNVREPQGTLYMDGNTFIMRSVKRESRRDIELSVCFEDGLIACFFMENGSISLQLSNPNGTTIQMDTSGSTYMCSTYMDFQSQMNCQHSEKRNPKQTDSRNSKSTFGDPTNNFGRKEVERDCWRCILPSGTVLCNQKNGELAAMFRNGNVSEYKVVNSQCCQWTTTNSQGYQVVQVLQEKSIEQSHGDQNQTLVDQAEISPKLKAEKDQKMSPKTSKETKQIKKDEVAEVVPLKIVSMKKNEVIADAKERMGQEHESKTPSDVVGKNLNPLGQDLPKIVSNDPFKPCLFLLPKKRVVSTMDVETKCHIKSREDLVTLVWTPEWELIAQHSDGTQMYTRLSKSQSTLDNTVTTCKNNCVSSATQNNGLTTVQSSSVLQRNTMETAKLLSMESSASSASARTCKPSISTHLHDLMVSSGNVDWQIMKENYPIIWSEGDNIVVDISTHQNKYILSFCRSTGSLHLLLPGGQCMYTSGLSVFLDYSNLGKSIPQSDNPVEEVKDLETWEHSHVGSKKVNQDQGQQGQHNRTNGLYKFNLEEGAISHEDSFGDGFYASQDGDVQRLCGDRAKEAQVAEATNSEMLDKLKAPKLPTSLGPSPRLFVLHEDGHGYELFGPDAFDRELEKIQKEVHSFHISEAYNCTPTQGSLHTFIRRLCTNSEDFRPSLSCHGKRALESTCQAWPSKKGSLEDKPKHCAHLKRALPMLYSLPQVLLQTPSCKPVSKHNEFVISYRHVREYPTMDDTQIMEMDQYIAKLREWTVDALMSSSMAAADENLQQGEDVTGAKSEIPQVFATTPRLSGVSENTTLDGNKEKIRIAHLIMADLQAHIQQFKAKLKEDESVREEASSRALNKLSRCVAKNLLEEIMTSCSRSMCNKQDLFLYFSCEEGLQAWLKEEGRQNWDEVAQVSEEIVQGIVNVMPNGS